MHKCTYFDKRLELMFPAEDKKNKKELIQLLGFYFKDNTCYSCAASCLTCYAATDTSCLSCQQGSILLSTGACTDDLAKISWTLEITTPILFTSYINTKIKNLTGFKIDYT